VAASLDAEGNRLAGRVAIVTGAASGIGRASAILFARQGASVLLVDRALGGLEETQRLLLACTPSARDRVAVFEADVSSEASNRAMVVRCVQRFGDLHVFFANAGIVGNLGMHTSADEFARTLSINVIGVHLGFQAALEHMLPRAAADPAHRGVLLATSSVAGLRAGAGGLDYSASKAAVGNLVASTAAELSGTGIRVNCVNPGLVETGMTSPLFDMARARNSAAKIGQLNPLRRAGAPHEIAAVALFLASNESSYINGQAIVVDGGLSCSLPFVPGGGFAKATKK
jgi:NAD(P)-dependent dehydrogenase (short-subunit alcohol dehydrogenase family)